MSYSAALVSCPHCDHRLGVLQEGAVLAPPPRPGDVALCAGCSRPVQFDARLVPRKIAQATYERLAPGANANRVAAAD